MARGSVFKKDGAWAVRVDVGFNADGGRRQALRQGFPTKRAAEQVLADLQHQATRGEVPATSDTALAGYLDTWLATQRQRLRPTTLSSYERAATHITRHLGRVRLAALTPLRIEAFYAALATPGEGGQTLSPKTIRNIHVVLRKALGDADRLGMVGRNAAASARPPVARRPEFSTWSSEDLRTFFAAAQGERLYAAFVLAATTGMRRGEVVGLRWRDVDLDAGQLAVVQTITTANNKVVVSPPKTARSRRNVVLDPHTVAVLREHRRLQREQRLAAGPSWDPDSELVFTDGCGLLVHPDSMSRDFQRITVQADLPRIRLHDLRHTYATLALKAGVHPKVVSERLGHATVGITLDLYSHVTPVIARDAADLVASRIFGG